MNPVEARRTWSHFATFTPKTKQNVVNGKPPGTGIPFHNNRILCGCFFYFGYAITCKFERDYFGTLWAIVTYRAQENGIEYYIGCFTVVACEYLESQEYGQAVPGRCKKSARAFIEREFYEQQLEGRTIDFLCMKIFKRTDPAGFSITMKTVNAKEFEKGISLHLPLAGWLFDAVPLNQYHKMEQFIPAFFNHNTCQVLPAIQAGLATQPVKRPNKRPLLDPNTQQWSARVSQPLPTMQMQERLGHFSPKCKKNNEVDPLDEIHIVPVNLGDDD